MPKRTTEHKALPLRLNPDTYAKLVKMAATDGRSLNNWIEHNINYTAECRGIDKPTEPVEKQKYQTCAHCHGTGEGCMLCGGRGYYDEDGP